MAVFQWILWISIGIAIGLNVLYFIIKWFKIYNMEAKKQVVLDLLQLPNCSSILEANGYSVKDAQKRVSKHYENWKNLFNEGQREITLKDGSKKTVTIKWQFEDAETFSPEKLAQKVIELFNTDALTQRRKVVNKRISQLPERRQEAVLLQIESYLDMAENDEALDETLDLEEMKLTKEQQLIEQRAKEIEVRLAEKSKKKQKDKK